MATTKPTAPSAMNRWGPDGIPAAPEQFDRMPLLPITVMLAGPAAAGILMTGLVSGRAGYRDLLSRSLKWRVGVVWCAVALLTTPLVFASVVLAQHGRDMESVAPPGERRLGQRCDGR